MLRKHGLTEQQWRVLRTLAGGEAFEVTQLAQRVFLLAPSLSRMLNDLDAAGLIVRRTPHTDMRRNLISISAKGLALIEEVTPDARAIATDIEWRFGADRMHRLRKMLRELEDALAADLDEENASGSGDE